MRVLVVCDVHIKHTNAKDVENLMEKIKSLSFDIAIVAGDVLDSHEKVDTQLMNRAYTFIRMIRDKALTFVLVGNHDYINNQQFLTDAHWMNGMKEWQNVHIIDKPLRWSSFVLVPYVYPGRFLEALSYVEWKDSTCIFAHQEFKGCKMGAFKSSIGDEWDETSPLVISGHIHERQKPQSNIIYPGSAILHAFGYNDAGISIFTFQDGHFECEEYISLKAEDKKTIYVKIGDAIKSRDLKATNRFCVSGSAADIALYKTSVQYKILQENNVKIVFRQTDDVIPVTKSSGHFISILEEMIEKENNEIIKEDYNYCK